MTGVAIDRLGRGAGLAALSLPLAIASLPALLAAIGAVLVLLLPPIGLAGAAFALPAALGLLDCGGRGRQADRALRGPHQGGLPLAFPLASS